MRKFVISLGIIAVICAFCYGAAFILVKQKLAQQFKMEGYAFYLDGVAIDKVITDQLTVEHIFLAGPFWRLYQLSPDYIDIQEIDIASNNLFENAIKWPFSDKAPLSIEKINFKTTFLDKEVSFIGSAKQSPETPLLINFESQSKHMPMQGQVEIRVQNHFMQMVDIEFSEASLSYAALSTKRLAGWLSFSYEKKWSVLGEIEAGFIKIPKHDFQDSVIKLNGPAIAPEYTVIAKDRNQEVIVFEHKEDAYWLQQNKNDFLLAEEAFGVQMIDTISEELIPAKAPKPPAPPKPEVVIQKKPEQPKVELAKALPNPAPEPVMPVALPPVTFKTLVAASPFNGLNYTQPLHQEVISCPANNCWVARGSEGVVSYNPEAAPSYFTKLKDYETARQLREVLLYFTITELTVKGHGNQIESIALNGTTQEGRPAQIQLAVSDLE